MAQTPVLPEATSVGSLSADFVEKLRLLAATVSVGAAVSRGKEVRSASCGEDRFRQGDDLRQLPQILGCGGQ
jgi:hypothetical protein